MKTNKINFILDTLKLSQLIVENDSKDFRFYSSPLTINHLSDSNIQLDTSYFHVEKNDSLLMSLALAIPKLKVKEKDNKLHIHFLCKSSEKLRKEGYNSFIATSNWFYLKQ